MAAQCGVQLRMPADFLFILTLAACLACTAVMNRIPKLKFFFFFESLGKKCNLVNRFSVYIFLVRCHNDFLFKLYALITGKSI